MAGKSKLAALLTGDELRLAELAEQRGEFGKAADHFARGGEFTRALTLAARGGSNRRAIHFAFKAALGADTTVPADATARQAGELLKANQMWREAIILFELAAAYRPAAEAAAKLGRPERAAGFYEQAGDWGRAAACFESAQRWDDAVRLLGLRSRQLQKLFEERREGEAIQQKAAVDHRRAILLAKLGRPSESEKIESEPAAAPASPQSLERSGRTLEAFDGYLKSRNLDAAYHVALRMRHLPPVERADLLQRCGHTREAAALLCEAGLHPRAAHLLEDEKMWPEAARVWELFGDLVAAGIALCRGGEYSDAVRCFEEAGEPDLAADARSQLGQASI